MQRSSALKSILEACLGALNLQLATIDLLVVSLELDCEAGDDEDDDELGRDAGPQARTITWSVLFAEDQGALTIMLARGFCSYLDVRKLTMIPPIPPKPTRVAEQKARFQ